MIWSISSDWQVWVGFTVTKINTSASSDLTWALNQQTSLMQSKKQLIHKCIHSLDNNFKIRSCLINVINKHCTCIKISTSWFLRNYKVLNTFSSQKQLQIPETEISSVVGFSKYTFEKKAKLGHKQPSF